MPQMQINKIEERKSPKTGRVYKVLETSLGSISCFDEEILKQLSVGKTYDVEITEKRGFKNIASVKKEVTTNGGAEAPTSFQGSKWKPNTQTMYVSYAKDVFIYLHAKLHEVVTDEKLRKNLTPDIVMAESIKLIQQAKEAFDENAASTVQEEVEA